MAKLEDHPTVRAIRAAGGKESGARGAVRLDPSEIRALCLDAGADDVGFVSMNRPELDDQREEIRKVYPWARTLISIVGRMNREPIRSAERSVSNLEFHATNEHVNAATRMIVAKLAVRGIRAVNPSVGFPQEMDRFPGKVWTVSHKPVAVAAGLGRMGIHRNVIHPKFGNFILLGTVVMDGVVEAQSRPIDYNPCLECKLCIAACPVGAISEDGFNFAACYTHNYREFMGGFTDWVGTIAESGSAAEYRERVSDSESASMWQSLSYGANYKAAYCLSVCPAGEDVISPFIEDRAGFVRQTLKPLQEKRETIYVLPNSDAEEHVRKRFPEKTVKLVGSGLVPATGAEFVRTMHLAFQPGKSRGVEAVYHFRFTGERGAVCTVVIRDQKIEVREGLIGSCGLRVTIRWETWLRFLRKEVGIVWLLLTLQVRLKGDPRLLASFGKCFAG